MQIVVPATVMNIGTPVLGMSTVTFACSGDTDQTFTRVISADQVKLWADRETPFAVSAVIETTLP